MTTAIYMRCSTDRQTTESQRFALDAWLSDNPCEHEWFTDEGLSGSNNDRPQWLDCYERCRGGEFDRLIVWKKDRISRSMKQRLFWMLDLADKGVDVISLTEESSGDDLMDMLIEVVLAWKSQRDLEDLRKRTKAGIAAYKAKGKMWGGEVIYDPSKHKRSKGFRLLTNSQEDKALARILSGVSMRQCAREFGVSLKTIAGAKRRAAERI